MLPQLEEQNTAAGTDDADGFGQRLRRICRVVQRLGEQRDVYAGVFQR